MRKHFLILMLLALLPLAGWADDPVDLPSNLQVTFTAASYKAANNPAEIATATSGADNLFGKVVIDKTFSDQACTNEVVPKNAGTYYVRVKGDGTNYKATSKKVFPYVISKVGEIRISAKAVAKDYGDAYPDAGFYTVDVSAANFQTGDNINNIGLVVTPSFSAWDLKKAANVYEFTIEASEVINYNVVMVTNTANLTINKRNLIVTAKNLTVTYGQTPNYDVVWGTNLVEGDQNTFGTPSYDVVSTTDATKTFDDLHGAVGTYTITPKGLTSSNYTFDYQDGLLTVNQRAIDKLTFTIDDVTYNAANQLAALKTIKTVTDANSYAVSADEFTVTIYDAATEGSVVADATNAGTYYASITANGTSNYDGTIATRIPVKINKKLLNIITVDQEKDYDGASFSITNTLWTSVKQYISFQGLEDADATTDGYAKGASYISGSFLGNLAVSLSTADATDAGTYTINVSSPKAKDNIFVNYIANFVNVGIATINKLQVTLQPKNVTIQYGDQEPDWAHATAAMFTIGYQTKAGTAAALVAGDEVDGDVFSTMPAIERVVPSGKTAGDVGTYELNAVNYVVADGNYELKTGEPKKGTLTIQAATSITVIADDLLTLKYGEYMSTDELNDADALTYRISGVKNEDKEHVHVTLSVVEAADKTKAFAGKVGNYTIVVGDITLDESIADNYEGVTKTKIDGNLTVSRAPLKIEALTQSLMVGTKVQKASESTVKFPALKTPADVEALFDATNGISLKFSDGTPLVPVSTEVGHEGELAAGAATAGWSGTAATTDGVWVNGIVIDVAAYNSYAANNYILTGSGSEAKAGKLIVTAADAVLALDAAKTDATVKNAIDAADGKRYNVQLKNRNFKKDTWAVLVLPFETTVREISNAFGYAVVDVLDTSKGTGNYVYFKITTGKINANQPFMLKIDEAMAPDATDKITTTFNGKVIVKSDDVTTPTAADIDAGGTEFIGIWKLQQLQGAKQLWYNDATGWSYNKDGNKVSVPPTLAYLQLPAETTGDARIFIEEPDGSTTAITAIAAEGWYTLNGIRLQGAPTEKGVYINNGKKIVIK